MNRPSLSAAFGDKHEIYTKALSDYWERKFAAIRQAFEGDGSVVDVLMRVYDAALTIYFAHGSGALGCFVVSTAINEAPGDEQIRSIVAEGFQALDADFESFFKRSRAAGALRKDAEPKVLALLAVATMQSLAIRARTGSSQTELKRLVRKAAAVICA
jgi:TetR/AcrR family transcriptional regulator, copper-responsive repressor